MEKSNIDDIIDDVYSYNNGNNTLNIDKKSDTESIIDSSWLDNFNRLYYLSNIPEKEIMNEIGIYFIYINKNSYIEKILFEKQVLEKENEFSFISKESILKIIQSKKISTPNSKYKLIDILSYIIDISHEKIENLENISLKVLPIFNDIQINKSIFVFHNINTIYFIFKEYDNNQNRTTLKSILKDTSFKEVNKNEDLNSTKKVRIFFNNKNHLKKNNHFTKKKRYHI